MPVTFDPYAPPIDGAAIVFAVVRYHRDEAGDDRFEPMPNVRVESVSWQEGPVPPSAQFSYVLDSSGRYDWPYLPEDLWPIGPSQPYVFQPDDELIVYAFAEDGSRRLIFNGFVQTPQVDMRPEGVAVTFAAVGTHIRLWDTPVQDAAYRDADDPDGTTRTATYLPVWFNPNGRPNCTAAGEDHAEGDDDAHPLFLDVRYPATSDTTPRLWTLGGFVRYLAWETNPDQTYVNNPVSPNGADLDDYLGTLEPANEGAAIDPSDPETYTVRPITLRSFDATGKGWVDAVAEQLGYHGYSVFLETTEDPEDPGVPVNAVVIYRTDGRDGNPPKTLFMPAYGASIAAAGVPAFSAMSLVRDRYEMANSYRVTSEEDAYEVSIVLAPGFTPSGADASDPAQFNTSALLSASGEKRKKYRVWVADEAGLGHHDKTSWVTESELDLTPIFGDDGVDPPGRVHALRLRPGLHTLHSRDSAGQYRKAELAISRDYAGPIPAIWDRSGTWQSLGTAGWRLLPDRCGIEIIADSPDNWKIPKSTGTAAPGDVVRCVKSIASPETGANAVNKYFYLRLTTVLHSDRGLSAEAPKRIASPGRFTTQRVIDARDHWRRQWVHESSAYNTTGETSTVRDDSSAALAHAMSLRSAGESVRVAGQITIPYITFATGVGDFVAGFDGGRTMSFQQVGATDAGEGDRYPVVVGFTITCQNPQSTVLKITDRRAEPESITHGWTRST